MTKVNPTLQALAETLLWSSCDDEGEPLDRFYTIKNFDADSLNKLYADYQLFLEEVEAKISAKIGNTWSCIDDFYNVAQPAENQTEHDYVLTRGRHGSGFWDGDWDDSVAEILTDAAQKQSELSIVCDNGRIYLM